MAQHLVSALVDTLTIKGIKWGHINICGGRAYYPPTTKENPLLASTEKRFCPHCQRETNHVVVLVDKSFGKRSRPLSGQYGSL